MIEKKAVNDYLKRFNKKQSEVTNLIRYCGVLDCFEREWVHMKKVTDKGFNRVPLLSPFFG